MPNMTFAVPEDMHRRMREHSEVQWSQVVRNAIDEKLERLEKLRWMDELLKDSKLTEEDAIRLGREARRRAAARSRAL